MGLYDDNQENSFLKKATALAAGIGGVVAFNKLGGAKFLSDELPVIGKVARNVLDDLSDIRFKNLNAENIGKVLDDNILGKDSLYNTLKEESNLKTINTFGDNLVSSLIKMEELRKNPKTYMRKRFQSEYVDTTMESLGAAYPELNTKEFEDAGYTGQLKKFIDHVLENNDLVKYVDDEGDNVYNTELVNKFLSQNTDGKLRADDTFLDKLFELVKNQSQDFDSYLQNHTKDGSTTPDLIENILKEYSAENLKNIYGTKETESIHQKIINDLSKTRSMTLDDYYVNSDKFAEQSIKIGKEEVSVKDILIKFYEENPEYGDMFIDAPNLKINNNNEIISYNYVSELKNKGLRGIAGNLFGKIFKVSDYLNIKESGSFNYFKKGKVDIVGESTKTKGAYLTNDYVEIRKKMYRINDDNTLSHTDDLDDIYGALGIHGSIPRMLNRMSGKNAKRIAKNKLAERFDIGTTAEKNIFESMASNRGLTGAIGRRMTGMSKYNVIDEMLNPVTAYLNPMDYRDNLFDVSSIFSNITRAPSISTFKRFEEFLDDTEANEVTKRMLRAAQLDDMDEMIKNLYGDVDKFSNKDLISLIKTGSTDRERAMKMLSIKSDQLTNEKNAMKFKDMIRREVFKEAILNEGMEEFNEQGQRMLSPSTMLLKLRRSGITSKEYENAKDIAYWGLLQDKSRLYNSDRNRENSISAIKEYNNKALELLESHIKGDIYNPDSEFYKGYQQRIQDIKSNYKDLATRTKRSDEEQARIIMADSTNAAIMMRKGYSPKSLVLDLIKDKNDYIKQKASLKKFGMQFIAGRDNPEYITTYTMIPYFMTQRLTDVFDKFGLGLSGDSSKNVLDMWKNIGLKRILPVAGGLSALSYLNYRAKAYTGTSLSGAFAQGIANIDLGLRKIGDVTGIGSLLEAERRLNPISQYWLGEDYQDSEERKEYYENGYDEVRKGRWWAFGSASEFRGGKVLYYQPNFVKRANSEAKDIGIYGSEKEKWAHSWIPTPRHPFAPIRRLLNPYWLEKKHMEDRPYLETAPMFSAGTPWGAVLNPTIGRALKPVRKMHRNETRRGLVDPRVLIEERNERIKAKALDNNKKNLIRISQTGISNTDYTALGAADPNNLNVTLSVARGKILGVDYNGIGYEDTVPLITEDFNMPSYSEQGNINIGIEGAQGLSGTGTPTGQSQANNFNVFNLFESTAIGAQISNSMLKPLNIIAGNNANIRAKADRSRSGRMAELHNLANMPMSQAASRITNRQDESDLKLTTSRHDYINDALFSAKQLSGIYGFLAGLFGNDGRKVRPESAEKMSSFKRGFWDSNIGGLGGEVMEIARRFFPHDDHSWTDINPIKNTMPDWMPDRFKTGDPYVKVAKGEMRLPGAGYESMYKLRSDEYGKLTCHSKNVRIDGKLLRA